MKKFFLIIWSLVALSAYSNNAGVIQLDTINSTNVGNYGTRTDDKSTTCDSIQTIELYNDVNVNVKDITPKEISCWDVLTLIISFLTAIVAPVSAVWLSWKLNKDNNKHRLDSQRIELQQSLQTKKHDDCIKRQGDILGQICTINKQLRSNNTISEAALMEATYNVVAAYPYLGKKLYDIAKDMISILSQYTNSMASQSYSDEDQQKMGQKIKEYMDAYQQTINGNDIIQS